MKRFILLLGTSARMPATSVGALNNQVMSLLGQEGLFFVLTYIPDLQVTTRYRAV